MLNKEYIDSEIKRCYEWEDNKHLSMRLGISEGHLRVKAKRLQCKKGTLTQTNKIINGYKRCPHCNEMKRAEDEFRKDRHAPNQKDYY